ncbi:MAG TPA: HAD-IIIA family hydrolase [Steroidobacteraceae bacterium]|nr:HAD-IIIA family hydrolase [Steroidobacteraceae bacterium]
MRAARAIRLLVLDVDGVLTDGRLYFGPQGEALKVFDVRDGLGLTTLAGAGVELAVISGRRSPMVSRRCRELGVRHVHQGARDKLATFERLRGRLGLAAAVCACVGDDLPDLPLMRAVGLAFAVADAHPRVRRAADVVTRRSGGRGAVREVCELLLAPRAARVRVRR